ncbi:MAG TPA: class I SAM-dependent methyltransferase [Acidimicrobiales bacterium]|nr:class I SAM-dependent methyltransferase [Acidimicrobiales bacterium]
MAVVTDSVEEQIGALAEKVAMAAIGALELLTVELGVRLGLYDALASGPATPTELAKRAGIDARYAREWLEQQATAGLVAIDADPVRGGDADDRVFSLPIATAACLLDPESLAHVAPMAKLAVAAPERFDDVVAAYRAGTGLTFGAYGDGVREFQAGANRPQFVNLLASEWLPAMPDVVAALERGARVADVACGCGWSSIAFGRAFPAVTVDGYDLDEASIADAARNAAAEGLSDRLQFAVRDAADAPAGTYDLVCCFEALHDLPRPVEALRAMRSMVAPGGTVFIVDERAADELTANDPDPMQHLFYAASTLHCLLVGRSEEDGVGTGTVMRTATLERYAHEAGFTSVDVLPIEHMSFRFYRLAS